MIIHAKLPAEEGSLVAKALQELGDKLADTRLDDTKIEEQDKIPKNVSAETFSFDQSEKNSLPPTQSQCINRHIRTLPSIC